MKPILFFLCLFALLTLALTCQAADTAPPLTVDWPLDAAPVPVMLVASCATGQCAARPFQRVGRIATAPVRAILAARPLARLAAAQPLRRAAAAIVAARPLRRVVGFVGRVRPLRRVGACVLGRR